jgi:HlyD family secretion protein
VYETDIGRVRVGQEATVHSPALPRVLRGSVERIRPKVGKLDALGTDPAARTDARVVEVEIRLAEADSEAAAALTNLQVTVEIEP